MNMLEGKLERGERNSWCGLGSQTLALDERR